MSILKWFNKPKWQNTNEQVRLTAIKNSQDPDLIGQLSNIVNQDPSVNVQITALNKMQDFTAIFSIAQSHPNKAVRKAANKKIINWFSQVDDDLQSNVLQNINEKEVIHAIAQSAKNINNRLNAIKKITQQGFLSDLLLSEKNTDIQNALLDQISQEATLQRLLAQTSKKNKSLHNLIESKLKLDSHINNDEKATSLCLSLESVVHGKNQQTVNLDHINKQWQTINKQVSDTLKTRFAGAYEAARMILDPQHRSSFLAKQKSQRSLTVLSEVENWYNNNSNPSLSNLQSTIDKTSDINIDLLSESDAERSKKIKKKLISLREQLQLEQKVPDEAFHIVDQLNKVLNQSTASPQQLTQFKSKWQKATTGAQNSEALNQLEKQFQQQCLKLAEKIEHSADLRDQAAKHAVDLIEKAIEQIEEGHLSQAKVISNQIAQNKKTAGYSHPVIKKNKYKLDQVWTRLKELRDWQKWSNDKARRDIIQSLASIQGQGLHPDAVLKKLKDSNEQWYALEDMEKLEGDKFPSRNQALWQQFREVSKAIFEPTQPFFEKRSEQQSEKLKQINNLIDEMNACDIDATEERELARISRAGVKELKALDQLPPKQRGMVAKKLRTSINRIDKKLNESYQSAENKKLALIEQAKALYELSDIDEAIEAAKKLQQQWKTAGIVKQYTERKLWKKFRKANDRVFNKREQIKQEINDEAKQLRANLNQFIKTQTAELKSINDAVALQQFKTDTIKQWNDFEKPTNFMVQDFNNLMQLIDESITTIQQQAQISEYKLKAEYDQLYQQYETGKIEESELKTALSTLDSSHLNTFFTKRLNSKASNETLSQHLIAAEFLTGLKTPDEFMEQRMAYQVHVLSERMSGEKITKDNEQAQQLLDEWYLYPKSDTAFIKKNQKRITQIIKALKALALG